MKYLILLLGIAGCMPPGLDGRNGNDGATGAPGRDGVDAVPVRVVQLCPGTTNYPTVFVEIALCIENELWGVYSANGGFLTKLPPGAYQSNAIGSACNLTVLSNCEVNHE